MEIPSEGRVVHLKGYGFVKVFRAVSRQGWERGTLGDEWPSDDGNNPERVGSAGLGDRSLPSIGESNSAVALNKLT